MKKQMPNLSGFSGTEQYHYLNFLKNLKFTDGWAHLAQEVSCFWFNGDMLYKQKINYTDFPDGKFEWYQCNDVVMLKGEY